MRAASDKKGETAVKKWISTLIGLVGLALLVIHQAARAQSYRNDVTGLYWEPNEPGWSLMLQRNTAGTLYALWFTFDEQGKPTWLVMPNGQPTASGVVEGDVYFPEGPAYDVVPFDSAQFRPGQPVGRFRIEFPADSTSTVFHYSVRGHEGTKVVQRLTVKTAAGRTCGSAGVLWNPAESGWALAVIGGTSLIFECDIHALWATYGPDRKPTWLFAALTRRGVVIPRFSLDLYEYAGFAYEVHGSFYGAPYEREQLRFDALQTTFSLVPQQTPEFPYAFRYSPGRSVSLTGFRF